MPPRCRQGKALRKWRSGKLRLELVFLFAIGLISFHLFHLLSLGVSNRLPVDENMRDLLFDVC